MFEEKYTPSTENTASSEIVTNQDVQAKREDAAAPRRRRSRVDAWFSTSIDISKARRPAAERE